MDFKSTWQQCLSGLITGTLTSIGMLFPVLGIVSLIGYIAFIVLLHAIPGSRRSIIVTTLSFGFAYCGGVHIWLWDLLPLDWLGVTNPLYGYTLLLFYWSTIAFSFGTVFLLFTFTYLRYKPAQPIALALFAASLWTVVQYLQMWGTSLVTAGDGSLFGAHYSTVMLGYAAAEIPAVLFLTRYGGVFIMSFIVVFIGVLLAHAFRQWMTERNYGIAIFTASFCIIILATCSLAVPRESASMIHLPIGLVTTNFSSDGSSLWEHAAEKIQSLIDGSLPLASHGTLYVLPEGIPLHDLRPNNSLLNALDKGGHSVLFSNTVAVNEKKRLRMSLYHNGTSTGFYDKMLLSPQGEYGPWFYQVWLGIIGGAELVEASRSNYTYERGEHTAVVHIPGATVGALFCSDILSPQLYRLLTLEGATVLTESTSLGWFHSSPVVDSVMLTIARVRAAENNRYLVVAGNAAPSTIISNTGAIIQRTEMNSFSILYSRIPVISDVSFYTKLGNLVLIPLLCICAFFIIRSRRLRLPR